MIILRPSYPKKREQKKRTCFLSPLDNSMKNQVRQGQYYFSSGLNTGCSEASGSGANIIFIEKRISFPASLRRRQAKVPDSCSHERKALSRPPDIERKTRDEGGLPPMRSLSRICNVFLTKMDALLPETQYKSSLPVIFQMYSFESHVSGSVDDPLTSYAPRANPANTDRHLHDRAHSGSRACHPQRTAAAHPKGRPSSDPHKRSLRPL